jgi:hypothetical protein
MAPVQIEASGRTLTPGIKPECRRSKPQRIQLPQTVSLEGYLIQTVAIRVQEH